ncbi:MAG: hypothetical protein Q9183_001702 [Haloplaca sp. 2 TL-2023]
MEKINSHMHRLYERLGEELRDRGASVLESLLAQPDSAQCSCHEPGHCRIVVVKKEHDDGSISSKPTFQDCTCLEMWHDHHMRQLRLVQADLDNKEAQTQQLARLEQGIRALVVRDREIQKTELRAEQYWLRQDYARIDNVRKLTNLDLQMKARRLERANKVKRRTGNGEMSVEQIRFLEVDEDDLWIDTDDYALPPSPAEDPSQGTLTIGGPLKHVGDDQWTASPMSERTTAALVPYSTNEMVEHGNDTQKTEYVSLGTILTIDEIHARFADMQSRAAEIMDRWAQEDAVLAVAFTNAQLPPANEVCACTPEHRLYHKCLDFGIGQMFPESELHAQVFRSNLWMKQEQTVTADREAQVSGILREVEKHIASQMSDLGTIGSREGTRDALLAYLRRYEGREYDQLPCQTALVSSTATSNLVAGTKALLEGWVRQDGTREKRFKEMLRRQ